MHVFLNTSFCCSCCLLSCLTCLNSSTSLCWDGECSGLFAEVNFIWSGFKNIQISEKIETTCSSLRMSVQVIFFSFVFVECSVLTIFNSSQTLQMLLHQFRESCCFDFNKTSWTLVHFFTDKVMSENLNFNSFLLNLRHHDQYNSPHCSTTSCSVLWTHCCNLIYTVKNVLSWKVNHQCSSNDYTNTKSSIYLTVVVLTL